MGSSLALDCWSGWLGVDLGHSDVNEEDGQAIANAVPDGNSPTPATRESESADASLSI